MLERLFGALTHAVEGSPAIAMGAAFLWGAASVILSPCHIGTIPLIVGFIDEQGRSSMKRAFFISLLFASGILITISAVGVVMALAGRMLGETGSWGAYFVAVVLLVVGLYLLDVFPALSCGSAGVNFKRKGPLAAFILGLVFGVALGPCTFAFAAPVLGIIFRGAASHFLYGALLLAFYGAGHCSVIVFAGTFTEAVQRYLNWNERSKGATILKRICGGLLLFAGLCMIYRA